MDHRDLVVVGGSAGAVDALIRLVAEVPADLPAAVLIVVHFPADSTSRLPAILGRAGRLPARHATDNEEIRTGEIVVAPPDFHLTVSDGRMRVTRGPRENLHRPAVDPLFRSAALARGAGVVGVILSGALDDGATGLRTVREAGGVAVVQDPADAIVPSMPASARDLGGADHILPANEIGRRLPEFLEMSDADRRRKTKQPSKTARWETAMTEMDPEAIKAEERPGKPSAFGCPDCGGVLWQIEEAGSAPFRCRVGHAFTLRTLMAAQDAGLEDSLWAGLRALEEREALTRRLIERSSGVGSDLMVDRLQRRADEASRQAEGLRRFLLEQTNAQETDPLGDEVETAFDSPARKGRRGQGAARPAPRHNGGNGTPKPARPS